MKCALIIAFKIWSGRSVYLWLPIKSCCGQFFDCRLRRLLLSVSVAAYQIKRLCFRWIMGLSCLRWIFEKINDEPDLILIQPQVGHVYLLVFFEQGCCYGVAGCQHLVWSSNLAFQPRRIAHVSHTLQIRADLIAMTDGVTGCAMTCKQVAAVLLYDWSLSVTAQRSPAPVLPGVEPVTDHDGHEARVVSGSVKHPLLRRFVANQNSRLMAVTIVGIRIRIEAQLFGDEVNVFSFACIKSPARTNVIVFSVLLQNFWRIALGVNGDGIEENIFPNFVAEHLLHLRQARSFQRARIHAMSVDHVQNNTFAFDQIIIEVDCFSILINQWNIGKIIGTPSPVFSVSRADIEQGNGANHQQHGCRNGYPTSPSHLKISSQIRK